MRRFTNKLVLGGVPEQVNLPIQLCLERGIFKKYGIDVDYRLVPEGTGAMLDKLESGDLDVALTVTDAFIAGKAKGRKIQLIGTYVESPLVWAVAGNSTAKVTSMSNLQPSVLGRKLKFGISRLGSGSHTMAFYACQLHGIDKSLIDFEVVHNFDGLKNGTKSKTFDAFLWETFTTKPWFDTGELHKIGEVETPWTAFSFVGSEKQASRKADLYQMIKEGLYPALAEGVAAFKSEAAQGAQDEGGSTMPAGAPTSVARICRDFGHTAADATLWMQRCRYAVKEGAAPFAVDKATTAKSVAILKNVGLVGASFDVEKLWGGQGNENGAISFVQP